MPQKKILIVEDDAHIARLVGYNLHKAEYDSLVAVDGEAALRSEGKKCS